MADDNNPAPKPDFDFIMKQEPKPKRSLGFPTKLPKPMLLGGAAVILLLIVLIIGSLAGSSGGSNTELFTVLSDATTISTLSEDVDSSATNADTKALAVTVKQSLDSQEQQIKSYMTGQKIKLDPKKIQTTDKANSDKLATAKLNNNYDTAFISYLKTSLSSYQADLQTASKSAGPNLKAILSQAYDSNQVLLDSKLLK